MNDNSGPFGKGFPHIRMGPPGTVLLLLDVNVPTCDDWNCSHCFGDHKGSEPENTLRMDAWKIGVSRILHEGPMELSNPVNIPLSSLPLGFKPLSSHYLPSKALSLIKYE